MHIWLVSPAWRRYSVTRLVLAQRRWLCDELAARGWTADCVIVADDDNIDLADEFGFHSLVLGNGDVGEKFNAGYRYAASMGAEIFVHIGSDDWVHPDVFDILETLDLEAVPEPDFIPEEGVVWRKTSTVVAQNAITVADLTSGSVQECRVGSRWGCIPWLIPRGALEPFGFSPIERGMTRGIDGALARGMRTRPNWLVRDLPADTIIDFKSTINLTEFGPLVSNLGYGERRMLDALADRYPDELVEMAKETSAELAAVAA